MEINKEVYVEQEQVGDFEEIASSIRMEDMSLAFDMVSKHLYSNPIGSFIRELVSNAVDANVDNASSELVKVNIYKEGGQAYFQVKDEGKGMSPDHFRNVYMKWFNSDKREDNTKIGGWGLGSKSPLSYAEYYEVETVVDGWEYNYMIVRQQPVPTATLISSKETIKKSGTTVRVEIKDEDTWKLAKECNAQLLYFDNVYVTNEIYYYNNDFKILDADNFRVRIGTEFPYEGRMHIVLGQVSYPINWDVIEESPINIPVALKFNIGELPVTLSREELNYSDLRIKDIIKEKINVVYQDLLERYLIQMKSNDLYQYVNMHYFPKNSLKLGDYEIPFKVRDNGKVRHSLELYGRSYKIKKDNINVIGSIFGVSNLYNGKLTHRQDFTIQSLAENPNDFLYRKEEFNHWSTLYHQRGTILIRKKLSKRMLHDVASILGLKYERFVKGRYVSLIQMGKFREVLDFIRYVDKYVERSLTSYDSVPPEFIQEVKDRQKALEEERKGNITAYNLNNKKETLDLTTLVNSHKYVFYLDKDRDKTELAHYTAVFQAIPLYYHKQVKLVIVSPTTITKIRRIINVKKAELIFNVAELAPFFIRLKYSALVNPFRLNAYALEETSTYYYKLFKKIPQIEFEFNNEITITSKEDDKYVYTTKRVDTHIYNVFKERFDKIPDKRNHEAIVAFNELEKVNVILHLISNKTLSNLSDKEMIKYIIKKYKVTKLNSKYYGNEESN